MRVVLFVLFLLLPISATATAQEIIPGLVAVGEELNEPYLPPGSLGFTTWERLYQDQVYETGKWYDATKSEYEQCYTTPGPTFLTVYRRWDGLYCYYWSLYMHNRAITWMIVNAGLVLGTLDCEWVDARGKSASLDCATLQREFGEFTR